MAAQDLFSWGAGGGELSCAVHLDDLEIHDSQVSAPADAANSKVVVAFALVAIDRFSHSILFPSFSSAIFEAARKHIEVGGWTGHGVIRTNKEVFFIEN